MQETHLKDADADADAGVGLEADADVAIASAERVEEIVHYYSFQTATISICTFFPIKMKLNETLIP